jgi:hypothetical protein
LFNQIGWQWKVNIVGIHLQVIFENGNIRYSCASPKQLLYLKLFLPQVLLVSANILSVSKVISSFLSSPKSIIALSKTERKGRINVKLLKIKNVYWVFCNKILNSAKQSFFQDWYKFWVIYSPNFASISWALFVTNFVITIYIILFVYS